MLKRKKPQVRAKRRLLNVASSRRRIKRNIAVAKLHLRRRHYCNLFVQPVQTA